MNHNSTSDHKLMILYTTISSLKEAEYLAKQALEDQLAVCVNIIPGTQSIYLSNKKVELLAECCMFFKTTVGYLPLLEQWILARHPYEIPAILKWEATSSEAYYQYTMSNLTAAQ